METITTAVPNVSRRRSSKATGLNRSRPSNSPNPISPFSTPQLASITEHQPSSTSSTLTYSTAKPPRLTPNPPVSTPTLHTSTPSLPPLTIPPQHSTLHHLCAHDLSTSLPPSRATSYRTSSQSQRPPAPSLFPTFPEYLERRGRFLLSQLAATGREISEDLVDFAESVGCRRSCRPRRHCDGSNDGNGGNDGGHLTALGGEGEDSMDTEELMRVVEMVRRVGTSLADAAAIVEGQVKGLESEWDIGMRDGGEVRTKMRLTARRRREKENGNGITEWDIAMRGERERFHEEREKERMRKRWGIDGWIMGSGE